jgi:voltage-gated potassium channel
MHHARGHRPGDETGIVKAIRRMSLSLVLILVVIVIGILSYHFVEGMSYLEAIYMTVITISTVGFGEVKPLTAQGRIVTILIIFTWLTIGAYTISNLFKLLVEGEFGKIYGRKKVEKQILKLRDHYIVCGFGRIGKLICRELDENDMDFVAIDHGPTAAEQMERAGILYLSKDATSEEVLMEAGLMHARGIVTALSSDADNVFITLTARGLRPDIFILARASDESSLTKLKRAGANRVDLPYAIGGKRMAQALVKPTVGDFIDFAIMDMDANMGLGIEEMVIGERSHLAGKNLIESNIRGEYGVIIVAIKKAGGVMVFNPSSKEILEMNDTVVVLGRKEELLRLKKKR